MISLVSSPGLEVLASIGPSSCLSRSAHIHAGDETESSCPPDQELKVVGNEKQWGSGRRQMLGNGLRLWRSRFIYNLNTQFLNKIIFPFPLSPAK
jgi:hypothetical protein